jgi:type IV secretion system protein TrbI
MTETLKLGGNDGKAGPKIRRLNRVPIIVAIVLVVAFLAVIIYGLTSRGLNFGGGPNSDPGNVRPASSDADQLKRGIPDGIIGEPAPVVVQPTPAQPREEATNPFTTAEWPTEPGPGRPALEPEEIWRARLEREQQEQWLRELHRQRMASLQADGAALDSPIAVNLGDLNANTAASTEPKASPAASTPSGRPPSALDLYAAAMRAGTQNADQNGQAGKESFFNQDIADLGYLPNRVVAQMSPYELKRGSLIPATLVTGINSDLPGRITAQVSQNVYDSATGRHLLIPQGSKLFGRYDSKVAFGQNRVLVIWTDIIFPNGSTLQIGGMAGTDAAGYGGFSDRVDNHYLRTFGSAILVALIGAGTEMMIPQDRNALGMENSAEDAARRSFAETFGQISEQTVSRNLNVQPTLEIRAGYRFNVLVDRDIVFPGSYR